MKLYGKTGGKQVETLGDRLLQEEPSDPTMTTASEDISFTRQEPLLLRMYNPRPFQ